MRESEIHVLYGDGTNTVSADADNVIICREDTCIILSRAAFREVVLGWHRLVSQEEFREEDR
jgi:hypothetical protein